MNSLFPSGHILRMGSLLHEHVIFTSAISPWKSGSRAMRCSGPVVRLQMCRDSMHGSEKFGTKHICAPTLIALLM